MKTVAIHFKEFITYFIEDGANRAFAFMPPKVAKILESNLERYWSVCQLCAYDKDVPSNALSGIGKLETFETDLRYFISQMRLPIDGWRLKLKLTPAPKEHPVSVLSKVYFAQLSKADIKALINYYRVDLEMFGYDTDPYLQLGQD